jgi:hypothetical protein
MVAVLDVSDSEMIIGGCVANFGAATGRCSR